MELIFQEDNLLVKNISTHEEFEMALRLRHKVFREELKWVPERADGLDLDEFDDYAYGIGIYSETNELIGHVRLIEAPAPFMIEHDFSRLLPNDGSFKKTRGMAESTRICIDKDYRTEKHNSMTLAHLLYKAMYHWSKRNDIKKLITIVEKRYYVLLKRSSFPFVPVGEFGMMGEGVLSGIISLDWGEFDRVLPEKRPEFYEWFTAQPSLHPALSLSHGLY